MRRHGLLVAAAIVLLVNAVVLVRVAVNRTGEPNAVVTLTERELPLAWSSRSAEDSGVALRFDHSRSFYLAHDDDEEDAGDGEVLDQARLAALGFDVRLPADPDEAIRVTYRELSRRAFAVLELEGPRWSAWRRRVEARVAALDAEVARGKETVDEAARIRQRAADELHSGSRLFIVDAGLDAAALRRQYPDRRAHLILPAQVHPRLVGFDWKHHACQPPACRLGGSISLLTREPNVPKQLQDPLRQLTAVPGAAPRYLVDLTVGRNHEPWITAIRPLAAKQ